MALIRATCSDCGDVELRSRDLAMRRCVDTDATTYLFRCPACGMVEVRAAEPRVTGVLTAAGVTCTDWHLPPELDEPHHGAPVTHDDVLDFHELLSRPGWFLALESMTER